MDKNIKNFSSGQTSQSLKKKSGIFNCIILRLMKYLFKLRENIDEKNDTISGLHAVILQLHLKIKELENELQNYND